MISWNTSIPGLEMDRISSQQRSGGRKSSAPILSKSWQPGGFATPYDDPDDIQLNDAEFKAIFDTARELRIPVTAHAYGPRLMKKLMGFGITGNRARLPHG